LIVCSDILDDTARLCNLMVINFLLQN